MFLHIDMQAVCVEHSYRRGAWIGKVFEQVRPKENLRHAPCVGTRRDRLEEAKAEEEVDDEKDGEEDDGVAGPTRGAKKARLEHASEEDDATDDGSDDATDGDSDDEPSREVLEAAVRKLYKDGRAQYKRCTRLVRRYTEAMASRDEMKALRDRLVANPLFRERDLQRLPFEEAARGGAAPPPAKRARKRRCTLVEYEPGPDGRPVPRENEDELCQFYREKYRVRCATARADTRFERRSLGGVQAPARIDCLYCKQHRHNVVHIDRPFTEAVTPATAKAGRAAEDFEVLEAAHRLSQNSYPTPTPSRNRRRRRRVLAPALPVMRAGAYMQWNAASPHVRATDVSTYMASMDGGVRLSPRTSSTRR